MREPIKGDDIRPGDVVECESHGMTTRLTVHHIDEGRVYAADGNGDHNPNAFLWTRDHGWFILDRPTPALDLPTEPTLGWLTSPRRGGRDHKRLPIKRLATWNVIADDPNRSVQWDGKDCGIAPAWVTDFTPAVAVPRAALDELRVLEAHQNGTSNLTLAVARFLGAIDAANGDPR